MGKSKKSRTSKNSIRSQQGKGNSPHQKIAERKLSQRALFWTKIGAVAGIVGLFIGGRAIIMNVNGNVHIGDSIATTYNMPTHDYGELYNSFDDILSEHHQALLDNILDALHDEKQWQEGPIPLNPPSVAIQPQTNLPQTYRDHELGYEISFPQGWVLNFARIEDESFEKSSSLVLYNPTADASLHVHSGAKIISLSIMDSIGYLPIDTHAFSFDGKQVIVRKYLQRLSQDENFDVYINVYSLDIPGGESSEFVATFLNDENLEQLEWEIINTIASYATVEEESPIPEFPCFYEINTELQSFSWPLPHEWRFLLDTDPDLQFYFQIFNLIPLNEEGINEICLLSLIPFIHEGANLYDNIVETEMETDDGISLPCIEKRDFEVNGVRFRCHRHFASTDDRDIYGYYFVGDDGSYGAQARIDIPNHHPIDPSAVTQIAEALCYYFSMIYSNQSILVG